MPSNKSPGPGGFTCEYFKSAWTIVGKDLVVAIQSCHKGINSTILALIPKKTEAKEMKDYRPISCCNVKTCCLLMENVLLASELVNKYHKETVSPRCAVKIDISKAFDSVQWPFLLNTIQRKRNKTGLFLISLPICHMHECSLDKERLVTIRIVRIQGF
ncbi:unnamed protein product [Microthlaspi erraticum]|uniref:Reverse transcriptase domain-containing protein n=1 Tax=Microthlaspi erraticum TaxID=1685480 RepID=A0A6D2K5Z5_9BRAS|nr:unnamed protein product [Microthlaspi erraticum]